MESTIADSRYAVFAITCESNVAKLSWIHVEKCTKPAAQSTFSLLGFYAGPVCFARSTTPAPHLHDATVLHLLAGTTINDGGLEVELHLSGTTASALEILHNFQGILICNLAKDDVLAIEPGGDDGGDEELRAIAVEWISMFPVGYPWEHVFTYVFGPALAMERSPSRTCFFLKFSSANFSP